MTIRFPRRRMDDDGKWIIEQPLMDPAVERQRAIDHCRGVLAATLPSGNPAYLKETRDQARQKLQELEVEA